jgi:uncharacterized protein YggT (Ycf19 family)
MAVYRDRDPENDEFYETMPATAAVPDRARPLYAIEQLVRLIVGVIDTLLAIRIVLELLGANSANGFASFIYGITDPLVAPFAGLFNYTLQTGVVRFDLPALIAILVYSLIGYIVARLLRVGRV